MASPAAERYFATFPPAEQEKIRASLEGNPNGLDDWFNAAVKAGAVNPDGTPGMVHNEDESGGYSYSKDVSGPSGLQPGQTPTPQQLRQYAKEKGWSEDFNRYDDATLQQWLNSNWNPETMTFRSEHGGASVEKPIETGAGEYRAGAGPGAGGGAMGGSWGAGGGWGPAGDVPQFDWTKFAAPNLSEDPGFQFRLNQGVNALEHSASAKGTLRTGGTIKDILSFGQDLGSQEYQNAFNRALQGWGANFQGQQAAFAPQYGAWNTKFGAGEDRWRTQYQGDLSKYLNKENNIFSLLAGPAPQAPVMA